MSVIDWKRPLNLKALRVHFEALAGADYPMEYVPNNLSLVGLLMGYRRLYHTEEFSEYSMDISQGCNEEIRIRYVGKYLSVIFRVP